LAVETPASKIPASSADFKRVFIARCLPHVMIRTRERLVWPDSRGDCERYIWPKVQA
jgi:hypothetical protein